jgi:hypothetical protein
LININYGRNNLKIFTKQANLTLLILTTTLIFCSTLIEGNIDKESLWKIGREIKSLQLLNSLNLSNEQGKDLLTILEGLKTIEDANKAEKQKILMENQAQLDQITTSLNNNTTDIDKQSETFKSIVVKFRDNLESLRKSRMDTVEKLRTILSDEQLKVIEKFNPREEFSDEPDFKGYCGGEFMGSKPPHIDIIDRVRNMSDDGFAKAKEQMLARYRERACRNLSEQEANSQCNIFMDTLQEARSLSPSDFELRKAELAQRIGPHKCIDNNVHPRGENFKIERLLLNEDLIPVLNGRILN